MQPEAKHKLDERQCAMNPSVTSTVMIKTTYVETSFDTFDARRALGTNLAVFLDPGFEGTVVLNFGFGVHGNPRVLVLALGSDLVRSGKIAEAEFDHSRWIAANFVITALHALKAKLAPRDATTVAVNVGRLLLLLHE